MPFLIRPGVKVQTPSRNLGALWREMWERSVEGAKRNHAAERKAYPSADDGEGMTPAQLQAWKDEPFPDVGGAEDQADWQEGADDVELVLYSVSGEVWDEYQSLIRDGLEEDGNARSVLMRNAYRFIVKHAVDSVTGFEDAEGPYVIARDGDTLSVDSIRAIERDHWLKPMAQVAATYQRLSDGEKGNYGGQRQQTLETKGSNATAALSHDASPKGATLRRALSYGATSPTGDMPQGSALPAPR